MTSTESLTPLRPPLYFLQIRERSPHLGRGPSGTQRVCVSGPRGPAPAGPGSLVSPSSPEVQPKSTPGCPVPGGKPSWWLSDCPTAQRGRPLQGLPLGLLGQPLDSSVTPPSSPPQRAPQMGSRLTAQRGAGAGGLPTGPLVDGALRPQARGCRWCSCLDGPGSRPPTPWNPQPDRHPPTRAVLSQGLPAKIRDGALRLPSRLPLTHADQSTLGP